MDWDAKLYNDKHSYVWKSADRLIEALAARPGETILDLGCGTGHLTSYLASTGATLLGFDSSAEMIAEAGQQYPGIAFELGDARKLPWTNRFDAVFSNAALHWIREADQVARGVARALKPGGRFVAEFGGKGNLKLIVAALQEALQAMTGSSVESNWFFPSISTYTGILEASGLEVRQAALNERFTPLEGPDGMRTWLRMFARHFWTRIEPARQDDFFSRVEDLLRPSLLQDGTWFVDHCRIRVVARRDQ